MLGMLLPEGTPRRSSDGVFGSASGSLAWVPPPSIPVNTMVPVCKAPPVFPAAPGVVL